MTRLRFAAIVGVILFCGIDGTFASAEATKERCRKVEGVGYVCEIEEGGGELVVDRPPSPPTTAYPFREFWRPVLSRDAEGNTCIDYELTRLDREPTADDERRSEEQLLQYLGTYSVCPDAPALPTTTPAMEAASFLRQITLPVPEPYIQPGSLPVGFEAYLETGAATSRTYGPVDTPFGPLTLTATAAIYVDWDDPHDDVAGEHGPHSGQPGPYPDGEIRHVYQHHGVYDIAVRYVWTAAWAIGDITGTIDGVETSGSYPDPGFEAYSREAVGR